MHEWPQPHKITPNCLQWKHTCFVYVSGCLFEKKKKKKGAVTELFYRLGPRDFFVSLSIIHTHIRKLYIEFEVNVNNILGAGNRNVKHAILDF